MIANHTQSSYRRSVVATVLLLTLAATTLTRSAAETRDPAPGTAMPSAELRISARNETTGATYSGERVDANLFTVQLPVGTYVIKAELNARTGKPTPSPAVTGPVSLDPGQVAREITFDSVSTEFQTPRVILLDEDGLSARLEGNLGGFPAGGTDGREHFPGSA